MSTLKTHVPRLKSPVGHRLRITFIVLTAFVICQPMFSQSLSEVSHLGENISTVAVDGTMGAFNEGTSVRTVDLTDPINPIIGGAVDVGAVPVSLTVIGNHVYGIAEFGRFFVLDIADPSAPLLLGAVDWEDMKRSLWVRPEEDYAYVIGCLGVHVIDLGNLSSPSLLTTIAASSCGSSTEGSGQHLYVTNSQGPNLLSIYSLIVPSSPTLVGQGPARTLETVGTYNSLEIVDDHAYVGHNGGVGIVDISSVTEPTFVDSFSAARRILSWSGNTLIADGWGNAQVWDITDRENPSLDQFIGGFDQGEPFQTAILNDAVLRAQSHSLYSTDLVSGTPTKIWSVSPFFGGTNGLARRGDVIFTGTQPGIASIDVSDPESPSVIQHLDNRYAIRCGVLENHLYSLASDGAIIVWDISNPFNMVKMPTEYPLAGGGITARMHVAPNHLAVSANQTFHLFSVGMDGLLTEVSRFIPQGGIDAVALNGNTAYMARLDGSLLVYDITNTASPTFVQTIPVLTRQSQSGLGAVLEIEGNHLHMFVARAGYALLDASSPNAPSILGTFDEPEMEAFGLAVDGSTVYLGTDGWFGHRGIRILDISTPPTIVQVGTVDATFRTRDLLVHNGYLFSTETRGGIRVRNLYEAPATPTSTPSITAIPTVPPTFTPYPTNTSNPTSTPYPTNTFYPTHTPYPTNSPAPTCDPVSTYAPGDVTGDGEVNSEDILEILSNWKK